MSLEQVRGDPDQIDVRTDVYALGVILYEVITERLPYDLEHATLPQAIRIICEEMPKLLNRPWSESSGRRSRKTERIDRDLETIVLKALEKESERRYQSVAVMAEDVKRYLTNQPIQARPPSALYQLRKLAIRKGHSEIVSSMAFSADGKWLATGSYDLAVKLWDVITGKELFTFKGHAQAVIAMAFSPDGKRLVTGDNQFMKLWDATTGQELVNLRWPAHLVSISPDGKTLAFGGRDRIVRLWRAATEQEVRARMKW